MSGAGSSSLLHELPFHAFPHSPDGPDPRGFIADTRFPDVTPKHE
jgi:hypothetical protein